MNKPSTITAGLAFCLTTVLAGMTWLTLQTLRAEDAAAEASYAAKLEDNARLALWRMESAVAPIVTEESIRPYELYRNQTQAESETAELGIAATEQSAMQTKPPHVLLHFQFGPTGEIESPQSGELAHASLLQVRQLLDYRQELANLPESETFTAALASISPEATYFPLANTDTQNRAVFQARSRAVAQNQQNNSIVQQTLETPPRSVTAVQVGLMAPVWRDGKLLLLRKVVVGDVVYLQGSLLDWAALREELLASVRDLLPEADLLPVAPTAGASVSTDQDRLLAAIPVRLVAGRIDRGEVATLSPIMLSLIVAWSCLLLAILAAALLVRGILALSERRAIFVSAVTHELRTPLTTFRMYAEMLASGMVTDEAAQRHYLKTLQTEADRLTHLVENVLAYARLERVGISGRLRPTSVQTLLDHVWQRMSDHAEASGARLIAEIDTATRSLTLNTDTAAVDQILFNLVDNACKYGRGDDGTAIRLTAVAQGRSLLLRICDHGQGVAAADRRRLFQPFHKSAEEASLSKPGVGLGLALSRRLARDLGGDLYLEEGAGTPGACFVLRLPRAPPAVA